MSEYEWMRTRNRHVRYHDKDKLIRSMIDHVHQWYFTGGLKLIFEAPDVFLLCV